MNVKTSQDKLHEVWLWKHITKLWKTSSPPSLFRQRITFVTSTLWSLQEEERSVALKMELSALSLIQKTLPNAWHCSSIGVRHNFVKITIVTSSLYIWTIKYNKGNNVFSSCYTGEQTLEDLSQFCLAPLVAHMHHHPKASAFVTESVFISSEGTFGVMPAMTWNRLENSC